MLSAAAPQAREIAAMVEAVRERTQAGDGLVVFPEGQVLNQLTGRIDPLRHKLLIPGYLTVENESAVLEELRQRAPRALVLWPRRTDEYGPAEFGVDYGRRIFETWYKMAAMLQSGLDLSPIITHHFVVDDYEAAFAKMLSGQSGKVILDWAA